MKFSKFYFQYVKYLQSEIGTFIPVDLKIIDFNIRQINISRFDFLNN